MSCAQCEGIEDQFGQAEARKELRRFNAAGQTLPRGSSSRRIALALDESEARDAISWMSGRSGRDSP